MFSAAQGNHTRLLAQDIANRHLSCNVSGLKEIRPVENQRPKDYLLCFEFAKSGHVGTSVVIPSLIFFVHTHQVESSVSAIGIPSFTPYFLDLRVITSRLTTFRHGGDPLVSNPFDPLGRNLNYPRIWLVFFLFNINDQNVFIGLVRIFLACISAMIIDCESDLGSASTL